MNTAPHVILVGASGDLVQRKLLPALDLLMDNPAAPTGFSVTALARSPKTEADWNAVLPDRLKGMVPYHAVSFTDAANLEAVLPDTAVRPHLFYLSLPPQAVLEVVTTLASSSLLAHPDSRVILEKPFGYDLESAQLLRDQLGALLPDTRYYLVDHYLGKESVQNMLAFRFANQWFEPMWNRSYIDHIQITIAESDGVASRALFYDGVGAVRDMVQNHLLQLVAYLTMDRPASLSPQDLVTAKGAVLEQVRVTDRVVRGQYAGYEGTEGSTTETFCAVELALDSERWQGVPIFVRTGKMLAARIAEVSIVAKPGAVPLFSHDDDAAQVLTYRIQPDEGIGLRFAVKQPGEQMKVSQMLMEYCYASSPTYIPDAYEQLLLDIIIGDRRFSLDFATIEAGWKVVAPLLALAQESPVIYERASWGPLEAEVMMTATGRRWLTHESTLCNGVSPVSSAQL